MMMMPTGIDTQVAQAARELSEKGKENPKWAFIDYENNAMSFGRWAKCGPNPAPYIRLDLALDALARAEKAEQERDDLAHVLDAREASYGISSNGNMWRFWSEKALETSARNKALTAERNDALTRLAAAEALVVELKARERYWSGEYDTVLAGRADEYDRAEKAEAERDDALARLAAAEAQVGALREGDKKEATTVK